MSDKLTDEQINAAVESMTSEELRIAFKFLHGYTERLRGDGATRAVEIVQRRREALGGRGFSADRVYVDETDRIRRVPAQVSGIADAPGPSLTYGDPMSGAS